MAFWKNHVYFCFKNPNDAQRLLLELSQINTVPLTKKKKINALIKAEKAIDRANKQKVAVRKLLNAEKKLNAKLVHGTLSN